MTANEYQKLAMRTKGTDFTNKELMLNAALGLAGEFSEFLICPKEEEKKEIGDIFWYIALMCEVCNIKLDDICEICTNIESRAHESEKKIAKCAILIIGNICDYIKKIYFQGHSMDKEQIKMHISILFSLLLDVIDIKGYDVEEIWQLNINKLKKRYPDGFKVSDSVNREEK